MNDTNAAQLYLDNLSSGHSRRSMEGALNRVAECLGHESYLDVDWPKLNYAMVMNVRSKLIKQYKPATANRMLSALRQTIQFTWKLGQMDAETCHRISAIKRVTYTRDLMGRYIEDGEMQRLCQVCINEKTNAGIRDLAIFNVLRYAGLRRSEVIQLDVGDFDAEQRSLHVRLGKGRQVRFIPIPSRAVMTLQAWLEVRGGGPNDPLFIPILKSGAIVERRPSDQMVLLMIRSRAAQANITDIRPHDFRRTYISSLFDKGVDISTIMQMAGHDKPEQNKNQRHTCRQGCLAAAHLNPS